MIVRNLMGGSGGAGVVPTVLFIVSLSVILALMIVGALVRSFVGLLTGGSSNPNRGGGFVWMFLSALAVGPIGLWFIYVNLTHLME